MSNGLAYFKKVYDVVPAWVQRMHDYNPDALDHYTNLRSGIMKEGHLSAKEKDLLLVGINAARLYERSMIYHTKGALDGGATIAELTEYLLVSYLCNGTAALKTGLKSLEYALLLKGMDFAEANLVGEPFEQMIGFLDGDSSFTEEVLTLMQSDEQGWIEEKLLTNGVVSSKLKHLLLVGIYSAELQGDRAGEWMDVAREKGASEEELAETGLICLLTAGIPAWFEASDSVKEKRADFR